MNIFERLTSCSYSTSAIKLVNDLKPSQSLSVTNLKNVMSHHKNVSSRHTCFERSLSHHVKFFKILEIFKKGLAECSLHGKKSQFYVYWPNQRNLKFSPKV